MAAELEVYISGTYHKKSEAKISVYDHGLLYGDGVFEGLRAYSGNVFRLTEHIDRLYDSARAICLEIPMEKSGMADAVNETIARNELSDAYVRLVVTRGAGSLGIDPERTSDPQVIIIADHIALYPKEMYENGLAIITSATIRNHPAALNPRIKSLNYLNNVMAKLEGKLAGCEEALMLNHKGEVAECTGDNIFIMRRGELLTPPIDAGILDGITRGAVLDLAGQLDIPLRETALTRHDIYIADECFLTGSAAEVIPVIRVDDRPIGDGKVGPVTKRLAAAFHELVRNG